MKVRGHWGLKGLVAVDPHAPPPAVSRGFGDTVAKFTHATGLVKVAKAWTRLTGRPCVCPRVQAWLNREIPYQKEEKLKNVPRGTL